MKGTTLFDAVLRPEPRPTTGWWRVPIGILVALAALLVPVSASFAAPGPADPQGAHGKPGKPGKPDKKPVWTGVPGTNFAHDTYGYPWPAALDCDESNVSSGGCVSDSVGFFQGQCTSWVAHRLGQRNGIAFSNWFEGRHWGNASEWSKVAKHLGYTSDKVPSTGAVGWYARGHVSYVEEVNADGSVVISEMNTDGHNGFVVHTVYPGESSWPDRFLHLGGVTDLADTTAPTRPSRLAAAPRGEDGDVELVWGASTDEVGVTGYRVLRNGVPVADTDTAAYVDRTASPGQAYTYSVVAQDDAGNVSASATTVLSQHVSPPRRQQDWFLPGSASVIAAGDSTAVCGRLGSERDQRVGCRLRTLAGWTTVRAGRQVEWGLDHTRAFLAGDDGRIWFCRVLAGSPGADACLPLDLATQSWGFDRVSEDRAQPGYASWVTTAGVPVRCGTVGDEASCAVLAEKGWRTRTTGARTSSGDPLSRAFVGTEGGVSFCRTVDGRATCTALDVRRLAWERARALPGKLPHGRWVSRPAGPTLCLPDAGCRTLGRTKDRS